MMMALETNRSYLRSASQFTGKNTFLWRAPLCQIQIIHKGHATNRHIFVVLAAELEEN